MPLKRLHHKLILYVLLIAGFLGIIVVVVSFFIEFNHSEQQTESMLEQLLDTVEPMAASAAYSYDKIVANEVVDGLLRNAMVHKVSIFSDKGLLTEKKKTTQIKKQKIISRVLYDPFTDGRKIGEIFITPETQFILMEAKQAAFFDGLTSIIIIAVTTLIILMVVRSNISNPLSIVSDSLHAIKAGEKNRIAISRKNTHDELGRLIRDINDLLENLEDKFNGEQNLRKEIQHIEKQLRHIFDSSSAGLFLLDVDGKLLTYNPTLVKILHYQNKDIDSLVDYDFASNFFEEKEAFQTMVIKALQLGQLESQDFLLHQNNITKPVWVHCLLSQVKNEIGEKRLEGVVFDVTQRVETEQNIRHEANHDSLTGLLLRQAVRTQFDLYLLNTKAPKLSVFLLDLDGFKQANDTYGHDAGDKVLIQVSEELKNCVRATDLVCRLGGDEFLVIAMDNQSTDAGFSIAQKMIQQIQIPVTISKDTAIKVGASIGIAHYPKHGKNFDDLVKSADDSMYEVKRKGKNGYGIKTDDTQITVKLI